MCHVVFESGLRGIIPLRNLLAPSWPASTAICCCEALDQRRPISHRASTGLFIYNISKGFLCKKAGWKWCISQDNYRSFHDLCQRIMKSSLVLFPVQLALWRSLSVYWRRGAEAFLPAWLGFTPATAVEKNRSEEAVLSPTSCSSHIICLKITLHCAALVPCNVCVSVPIWAGRSHA